MARARILKPDFFRSEEIGALSPFARLLFQGLWTLADRDGRLLDRPRRIVTDLLPYDDVDGEKLLSEIAANPGLIIRYTTSDGRLCIQITNFAKHQSPHFREPSLGLPGPTHGNVGQSPGKPRIATEVRGETAAGPSDPGMDPVSDPVIDPVISPPAPARDPSATAPISVPRGTSSAAAAATTVQQTSQGTSGEPGDDNGKASSLGQDPREGQAGNPPAGASGNRASASPPSVAFRLTVETLVGAWGQAREEEFGGLAWASGHGVKTEKLRDVVDALRPHPEAISQLDSDMRRFWRSVRHGEHDKATEIARSNSFAFGCWWSEFGAGLGPIPEIATPARTASARAGPRQAAHEVTRAAALRFLEREAAKGTAT